MTVLIDGPRLAPANGGPARSVVVFLHGFGADGHDLIDIGRRWASVLPATAFVSPHAPEPFTEAPSGRQWFPLATVDPHALRQGVLSAAPALNGFLDSELERHGLDERSLVLAGFSQGTMMALQVGLRRATAPAGIIGYSGLLPDPEHVGEAVGKPPVLLVHGDNDPLIPAIAMHAAVEVLEGAGFAVEAHTRRGLEHGIDEEGVRLGAAFAGRVLNATAAPE
ncbi:MAG: alpha/beta hydrolase [Alphaproteobacteria bacterium]